MKLKTAVRMMILSGGAIMLAGALLWRRNPSACPYSQRLWLEIPRPFIGRNRLRELLAPQPGERVLEVGPGTGYYALSAAGWISPGELDILDLQQEMLEHTMRRAEESGITNIVPTLGDARELPYAEAGFDAAYLVAVLGEIPDQNAALHELRRVLKPGGRLIVGEAFPDPHVVTCDSLRSRAKDAGLHFDKQLGGRLAYLARFRVPA